MRARVDRRACAWALVLGALTFAVYAQVRLYDFVPYDDPRYVFENPHVASGLTWSGVWWAWSNLQGPYWHPLTWLSHMVDAELFGLRAGGHHVTSVLLHAANTLLLFFLLRRMTGSTNRSAVVAALFAVHPLHVESVAWVAERKDVLSTAFLLLTIWAYVDYVRRPEWRRYLAVCLLYAGGLMAKPMLVTLPFALLLLDYWPLNRHDVSWFQRIREKLPLYGMAVAASVATLLIEMRTGVVSGVDRLPLALRLTNVVSSYVTYLRHVFWPVGLSAFYPYPATLPPWWSTGLMVLVLAGVSLLVVRAARRQPYLFVGWFWFVGTLVPVIGFVQAGDQAMADRFAYVPIVGVFVMVVWGGSELIASVRSARAWRFAVAGLAIAASAVVAHAQVQHWRNGVTLWTHAVEVVPSSHRAHASLAAALAGSKRDPDAITEYLEAIRLAPDVPQYHQFLAVRLARDRRLPDALAQFAEALRLKPNDPEIRTDLGLALANVGRLDEAIYHYTEAIRVRPTLAAVHTDLGAALAHKGHVDDAIAEFSEALRLDPDQAQAHHDLAGMLLTEGKGAEAVAEYRLAIQLEPGSVDHRVNLGVALFKLGKPDDAKEEFTAALSLDPGSAAAHNGLGVLLKQEGRPAEALSEFAEAVRLAPDLLSAHANLGTSLAEHGDTEAAVREFQDMLRLDPASEDARRALAFLRRPGPR